jgi:hypothetical protein
MYTITCFKTVSETDNIIVVVRPVNVSFIYYFSTDAEIDVLYDSLL